MLQLFATEKTAKYLQDHNIPASTVAWPLAVMEEEEREYPPATRYYITFVNELKQFAEKLIPHSRRCLQLERSAILQFFHFLFFSIY